VQDFATRARREMAHLDNRIDPATLQKEMELKRKDKAYMAMQVQSTSFFPAAPVAPLNRNASRSPHLSLSLFARNRPSTRHAPSQAKRAKLPAMTKKDALLEMVGSAQVTVICGETGCGKSTQCPQYLLDDAIDNGWGDKCQILCTQPRRISAIGVADRVADERSEKIGDTVGYQIRLEKKCSARTRLLFMTTGIMLRRLQGDPELAGVSHVVIDEVHERTLDSDFLLIIIRDLLPRRPDLKLILMSGD